MILEFPNFKPIELSDKGDVEKITNKFPPYSDFNFVSMFSWDIKGEMRISQLYGNLIVRFTDYITGEPFYSFLGSNKVNEVIDILLKLSLKEGINSKLKLVPEASLNGINRSRYTISEDRDHFDYILSLEKLSNYEKHRLRHHISHRRHFLESYSDIKTKVLDLKSVEHKVAVMSLTTIWMKNKIDQGKSFLDHLEEAVKRYLIVQEGFHEHFISVGLFNNHEKLIAFTVNELIDQDHYVCHFMKGDNSFRGIYSHLVCETSKILLKEGRKYINFEQDLGLANLRQSKKTFEPVDFLKKYIVIPIYS